MLVAAENGIVLGPRSPTTTNTETAGNATAEITAEHSVTDSEIADSTAEPNSVSSEMNPQLLKVSFAVSVFCFKGTYHHVHTHTHCT